MTKIIHLYKYSDLEIERAILELNRAIRQMQNIEFMNPQVVELMRKEIIRLKKLPCKKSERL